MEGIQTIQALKAVQSSLPAQTTIPSDELVMLYAADGTPIAKIARDDLVKAVASVMASNSQTTFSKLLGVQANGTPMGIGASDLASVLGVNTLVSSEATRRLIYSVVRQDNETASIDNVKNILSSMFVNPSNKAGVSIVQCVFSGGVCYTCLISHDGADYFAAYIMSFDLLQPVYIRYDRGTWK